MFWVLSGGKTLDWWLTLVCVGLFYTCYMEFGWVTIIWLSCASFVASLWLIQPCFSCSLIHGLHTLYAFFSTLLKTLMLLSPLKYLCSSTMPRPPQTSSFSGFSGECNLHTLQERDEQWEKCCGLMQTVANAYLFHWVVMLGKATVAHTLGNGLTNQICKTIHTCHFSFPCR